MPKDLLEQKAKQNRVMSAAAKHVTAPGEQINEQESIKGFSEEEQKKKEEAGKSKTVSANFKKDRLDKLETLKVALGTKSDSDALRWIFDKMWEVHGEKIETMARQKSQPLEL
ncbi:hypothetical protein [uncultured Methanolobus sp.]|uniref:hypothetical protein n=1 Tax=uncultured Methanolobus sp. TaxID=218300 RepID=UPI002AAB5501|nr:hypothetical protein [uncultured Methanolobus sp.]